MFYKNVKKVYANTKHLKIQEFYYYYISIKRKNRKENKIQQLVTVTD